MNCIYIGGVSVYSVTLCLYVGGVGCTNDVHILVQVNKVSVLFCSVNSALCIGSISFFYLSTEVNVVFGHVFFPTFDHTPLPDTLLRVLL